MPRAGLTPAAVVALGLDVVDAGGPTGWADLSLSAVAARAGVAVPSLYKHVDGLPGLRRAVAVACVDQLTAVLDDACADLHGTDALRATAHALRAHARTFPGRYQATQTGAWVTDPQAVEVHAAAARTLAVVERVVGELGIPDERHVDAVRAVRAAVHGFVVLELDGGFGMPEDVEISFGYLVDGLVGALGGR
ncbi:TetR-like C-terminal domain-containing protein [Cellulomonas soli]|uniref:TetR family transcriptional regulator n=1 Tax=Cellulomonas soli TaxID=931535 RepID=A0A512PFX3_9CELL|nr:TetR-like C-terminal domain-containing protein [Cellulomonas soli]NYI59751.1 AcrR family transcriptional regulator [Cellulomonas soli]GEP70107.1 TetR family transcriptional regulator [Cellulomonas soli]